MKVLVTGAVGYIGSHVVSLLKSRGHYVDGLDNLYHGEANEDMADTCMHLHYVDVLDRDKLEWYYKHKEYECVVHLAGLSSVPRSMTMPYEYFKTNVEGTKNVLECVNAKHIIFAGTSSSIENASPYAVSKTAAEYVIRDNKKMGWTIFRFFNVSGSDGIHRQLGPATHLIRVLAEVATGKRDKLTVYGDDYPTRDGTCIRDYVHVKDLSEAIVNAVEQGPMNTKYEELGHNKGFSVFDVVKAFEEATGCKIPYEIGSRREGDAVECVVSNLSKLIKLNHSIHDMCLDQYNLELYRQSHE